MPIGTTAQQRSLTFMMFLRAAIALQTVAIFFQAVTAGLLLSTSYGETLHGAGARGMYAASMLYVLTAILVWRPGGGSPKSILHAFGFLVLASVQVVLGIAHVPSLHVPLGVLMFGLSVLRLGQVLAGRRTRANAAT
ncbi:MULTISPECIES: hypothetical protein [unclassified Streptomyces]|uniref:hypothetical protein n=1 Tax=unclassified Streptomyces TaxID=2593676 RepID=UPI00225ABA0F|nr:MULTISPECIES: hypothetical protein [unclassified Streptomyces]WSP57600.1 hypothetical protein OG306_26875 [Streptomyces sp. NBC_01241]WSU21669.1 hypothetical protein OG508_12260 [Streptomyces sp. NBC_01108]MCX4789465.1 hypothetical protein [Streptomyces sp. NBC_01221]MCX4794814.1 hypothetical protein [Streptomyces sp. NBC_01242]WSJ36129.1 hypothetical protein OG772_08810 [Streptomyces sp. NBC_01321]